MTLHTHTHRDSVIKCYNYSVTPFSSNMANLRRMTSPQMFKGRHSFMCVSRCEALVFIWCQLPLLRLRTNSTVTETSMVVRYWAQMLLNYVRPRRVFTLRHIEAIDWLVRRRRRPRPKWSILSLSFALYLYNSRLSSLDARPEIVKMAAR